MYYAKQIRKNKIGIYKTGCEFALQVLDYSTVTEAETLCNAWNKSNAKPELKPFVY